VLVVGLLCLSLFRRASKLPEYYDADYGHPGRSEREAYGK
jgi:hypothetical protein